MELSFKANPISVKQAKYMQRELLTSKFVDIICHSGTDEDAIACANTMQWFLKTAKIPSRIILDNAKDTFKYSEKWDILDTSKKSLPQTRPESVLCVDFSSKERIIRNVADYINKAKNILCLDHHENGDIVSNITPITEVLTADEIDTLPERKFYVDSTAKSCSGVLLRFFDTLRIKLPDEIKTRLLCGMTDDLRKNHYLEFDDTLNPVELPLLRSDFQTRELYSKLKASVSDEEQKRVIKHLNVLASLNPEEIEFKNSLPDRIRTIPNGKFGCIVIPPDDRQWERLGGDNKRTSAIIGNFRVESLKKYPHLKTAAVFYPANGAYRISIHSSDDNVLRLFNYIKENINPELKAGGHENRGGGSIPTLNPDTCEKWVKEIIHGADEFYNKSLLDGN